MNLLELFHGMSQDLPDTSQQFKGWPMYKEGLNMQPRNLQDLFRYGGIHEKMLMNESQRAMEERVKQQKIQQLLEMLQMYPEMGDMEGARQFINNPRSRMM